MSKTLDELWDAMWAALPEEVTELWETPMDDAGKEAFAQWYMAYTSDDREYQQHYQEWRHDGPTVATLSYGSDCTNAHADAEQWGCINADLVALYEFDSSADPWKDSAGSYDLTSDYPPGLSGFGMVGSDMPDMDGGDWSTGEYLNNPDVPLSAKEDFTVALWVQGTTAPANYTLIVGGNKWDLSYDPYNSRYRFSVGHGGLTAIVNSDSVAPIALNTSRCIILRKDADHISIWMKWNNSSSFDCETHINDTSYGETDGFGISDIVTFDGSGIGIDRFMGYLDEIAMWQRCLSDSEVEWLWGTGIQGGGRLLSTLMCGGPVVVGGVAAVSVVASVVSQGGSVLGGVATAQAFIPMRGGCRVAGVADVLWTIPMQGGCVGGGSATHHVILAETMTGGVVLGDGYFDNEYRYYDKIINPPYQVEESLERFLFLPLLVLTPSDTDGSSYLVTEDDGTTIVYHKVLRYDPATGILHLAFAADLNRTQENVFRIWYKP